jgi:hypothetical protein
MEVDHAVHALALIDALARRALRTGRQPTSALRSQAMRLLLRPRPAAHAWGIQRFLLVHGGARKAPRSFT